MAEVGVRELRNALSRYLRRVRRGESLVVTDRGEPVARIIPADIPEDIAGLISEGRITPATRKLSPPARPIPVRPGPPLSDYISEDRR